MNKKRSRTHLGRLGRWVAVGFLSVVGAGVRGGALRTDTGVALVGPALADAGPSALLSPDQVRASVEVRLERMQERGDRRQRQRTAPGGPGVPGGATDPPVIRRDPPPLPPELLDRVNR
jgi:hypothetical protein